MPEPKEPSLAQPENIEAERIYREMLRIAKTLPPSEADPEEKIFPFGNNFSLLFEAIYRRNKNTSSALIPTYLELAENLYGEKWKKFLEDNNDLVNEILKIIEEMEPYKQLASLYRDLIFKAKASKELIDRAGEDTNFSTMDVDAWKRLNPLLKQASEAMAKYGIDPKKFYKYGE